MVAGIKGSEGNRGYERKRAEWRGFVELGRMA